MSGREVERDRLLKRIADKTAQLEARKDLNIKIPRLQLPSDYNFQDRSIFSLPPEILKPILASAHPKYRKKLAAEKRKGFFKAVLTETNSNFENFVANELKKQLTSYTALRKQREEFRQRLVNLIVNVRNDDTMEIDDIPSEEEKQMLRYYYYVKHGVDTVHVAPLDEKILNRVLRQP